MQNIEGTDSRLVPVGPAIQRLVILRRRLIPELKQCSNVFTRRAVGLIGIAIIASIPVGAAEHDKAHWTGTWSAAPETLNGASQYADQTLRMIVHTSVAGDVIRVRISNTFGTEPLKIGAAHVALRAAGARIIPNTDRTLLVSGKSSFMVPAGALALSDPVCLQVPPLTDVAVSIYLPVSTTASTTHIVAMQTNYVAASTGNFADATDLPGATITGEWDFLTGVDVIDAAREGAIVTLGDSATDGIGSTPDANKRWPDILAKRLQARSSFEHVAVLNEAITGNRILHPGPADVGFFGPAALARFDRDVLGQAGVKFLIVFIGLADIAQAGIVAPASEEVSAVDVIEGQLQLITRAQERGIVVYGCTLTPFKDSLIAPGFYSQEKEAKRQAVNEWIRTSGAYAAVLDFDQAVRDPVHPSRILPAYDSGDHTHPNDAGYRAMANAIDLDLFLHADSR